MKKQFVMAVLAAFSLSMTATAQNLKGFAYDSDGSVSNWPAKATVTVSNALSFGDLSSFDGLLNLRHITIAIFR